MTAITPLAERPHALYRFFDEHERLLYIGITASLPTRLRGHDDTKPWWLHVRNVTVEHFPDRESVLQAEKHAIESERPLHNVQHNGRFLADVDAIFEVATDILWFAHEDDVRLVMESPEMRDVHLLPDHEGAYRAARMLSSTIYRQLRQLAAVTEEFIQALPPDDRKALEGRAAADLAARSAEPLSELDRLIHLAYGAQRPIREAINHPARGVSV